MAKAEKVVEAKSYAQVYASPGELTDEKLSNVRQRYFKKYREMKEDPTLAFARWLLIAPLVTAGWSYKARPGAPFGARDLVERVFEPRRIKLMKDIIEGHVDYGFAPFELVWDYDESTHHQVITKFKLLLQPYTQILVDEKSGDFKGLLQEVNGADVRLEDEYAFNIALDVEGTDWYGIPLMQNAMAPYDKWNKIEEAAARYDAKVAGTHLVIHYPIGSSMFNGVETDNHEVAKAILNAFEASGKVIIPRKLAQFGDTLEAQAEDAWKIELLADPGNSRAAFIDRQKYLDALKVRSFGIPERSVLEGQFGTKAESEAQADFAIVNMELKHIIATQQLSLGPVNRVLELNCGKQARDTVCIEPTPLTDEKRTFLREIYKQLIANPDIMLEESDIVDLQTLRERLGIPAKDQTKRGLFAELFNDEV